MTFFEDFCYVEFCVEINFENLKEIYTTVESTNKEATQRTAIPIKISYNIMNIRNTPQI